MIPEDLKLEELKSFFEVNMMKTLGIELIDFGKEFLKAKMPVDQRTMQPFGILHGGASVTLAESLGSMAASIVVHPLNKLAVGLEINSNHIKAIRSGFVIGETRPIHIGKSTHVWEVKIHTEEGELVNISRITMAIVDKK